MKSKNLLKLLGAICLALVIAIAFLPGCAKPAPAPAPEPAPEVYKWRASHDKARGSEMSENFVNLFCKQIEKMSGGRIEIEPFSWGELVAGSDILEAIAKGTLDLSNSVTAYHPEMFASIVTFGVPGGLKTPDDWQLFLYDYGYRDFMQKNVYGSKGVYLLGTQLQPGMVEFLREEITSFDDLEGMKLRSFGANGAIFGALGASIANITIHEAYEAVATGVVDGGTVGALPSIVNMSLQEVIKTVLIEPRSPSSCSLPIVINLELWNSLPDDLKAIIHETTIAYTNQYFQWVIYQSGTVKGILKEAGVTTYVPTDADMVMWDKAVDAYWDELSKKSNEAEALEMLKGFMEKMGYR